MATVKQGTLVHAREWWKHLRRYGKREFWKRERRAERKLAIATVPEHHGNRREPAD